MKAFSDSRIKELAKQIAVRHESRPRDSHHFGHSSTSNTKTPEVGNKMLSVAERRELARHLLAIPSIADPDCRAAVIDLLPVDIRTHARLRRFVYEIIRNCLQYPNGMQELTDILQFFEGDSIPMQRFKEAVDRLLPKGLGFGQNEVSTRTKDDQDRSPFMLFLGAGCARAANLPSSSDMARKLFDDLFEVEHEMALRYLSEKERAEDKLVAAFYEMLNEMPSIQRESVLASFYRRVPIPIFYQDLATLIKVGYFRQVLTTNIDILLEEALNSEDLPRDFRYQVINLGFKNRTPPSSHLTAADLITIVKLHGKMVAPSDIEAALMTNSPQRGGAADIVMVGYEFESEPLNNWLRQATGGELWWVSVKCPPSELMEEISEGRNVHYINGEAAEPEEFFSILTTRLLHVSLGSASQDAPLALRGAGYAKSEPVVTDEYLLRDTIRRYQTTLHRWQQLAASGTKKVQLSAQIDYQKRRIQRLEEQLRELPSSELRLHELMGQISLAALQAEVEGRTRAYLRRQVLTVQREFNQPEPNQDIISVALSAIVFLSERLGATVVEPALVRELASFVPTLATKGV